jgi:hypothetical protein
MSIDDHREPPPSPAEDARDRRAATVFLLVAAALLVGVGVWLVDALIAARRADECIAAGRRNCIPLELPQR